MAINFSQIEEEVLKKWREKGIFAKTLAKTKNGQPFIFFEGPPTANAKPGVHHMLARVFKDIIPRYKTMNGYYVERKAGWDTHGLPVELEMEKKLGIKGKPGIEEYGIAEFNAKCKESVWQYKKEWEDFSERIGFWLDYQHPYVTYENNYIETLWWILKQIWDKNLLFQDYKVVPHCPRCGTTLSSHEVAQGYKNVEDISLYLKFPVKGEENTYFFVWTTTPWTLPGNVAVAVHPKAEYVKVKVGDEYLILAEPRLSTLENFTIIEKYKGQKLIGKKYEPLYATAPSNVRVHEIIGGDFVSMGDGTGLVHIAPAFGEDDMNVVKAENVKAKMESDKFPTLMTVESDGSMGKGIIAEGKFVKEADKDVIEDLKKRNLLWKTDRIQHDYPFCWRCKSPLIYYAKKSWFIKMSEPKIKEKLIANNEKINWIPDFIKHGRFGVWLQEIKDWALSRERYWGTPLPIWVCEKCGEKNCFGSFEEIEKASGQKIDDPHRPFIDQIKIKCGKCGGEMKRVPEVIDCWFDSGAMPFAQHHYPFENQERYEKGEVYPADFIAEGLDQTRGWFYTLLAISTLLGKEPAYKNVICHGLVLDENGEKMSKTRGNVVDPWQMINKYGVDAIRFYFYTLNQPNESKFFTEKQVDGIIKKVFLIFWNVTTFYKMYAANDLKIEDLNEKDLNDPLDQWIISKFNLLLKKVNKNLDNYEITDAGRNIADFINELSTWYLRRSRERFKDERMEIKMPALKTLRYVIFNLCKILAPFTPFLADYIYQEMNGQEESVHLETWPKLHQDWINEPMVEQMSIIQEIAGLGLEQRAKNSVGIRQPLAKIVVRFPGLKELNKNLEQIILDELNIKEILYQPNTEKSVELDFNLTPELKEEGLVRELVRQINDLRKKSGLTINDEVDIFYQTESAELIKMIKNNAGFIQKQTLAKKIESSQNLLEKQKEVMLDNQKIILSLSK